MLKNIKLIAFIIIITLFLIFNCPIQDTNGGGGKNGGSNSSFTLWAGNFITATYYKVKATKLYNGSRCNIYVENESLNIISSSIANQIGTIFDNSIYNNMINNFGNESDVDGNGKITIFILDIQDPSSNIAGYFDSSNLFDIQCSNKADMIYLDCYLSYLGDSLYETLCHEFQHLINYNENVFVEAGNEQDVWINEGLSSGAETLYAGRIISEKVAYFNTSSNIRSGIYFVYENNWYSTSANACYATVYLFFQWLRIQAPNHEGIFNDIISNANNDYQAVVNAAVLRIGGFTANDWNGVFSDWLIANYLKIPGRYGYEGIISTTPQNYASSSTNLYPGGAVYKDITPPFNPGGPIGVDIRFIGVTDSTHIDRDMSDGCSEEYLIVYNSNSNQGGSSQNTGTLPATSIIFSNKSSKNTSIQSSVMSSEEEKPFMIDYVIGKNNKFKKPNN